MRRLLLSPPFYSLRPPARRLPAWTLSSEGRIVRLRQLRASRGENSLRRRPQARRQSRIITDIDLAPRNARGSGGIHGGPVHAEAGRPCERKRDRAFGGLQPRWQGDARDVRSRRQGRPSARRRTWEIRCSSSRASRWSGSAGSGMCPKRPGILGLDAPRIPNLTGLVRAEIVRNERTHQRLTRETARRLRTRWPTPGRRRDDLA
jgi:hypothetical protein